MSDVAVSNANTVYPGGSATFDESAGASSAVLLTQDQVQTLINEAVAKAVLAATEKLQSEAGLPKFLLGDIKEMIQMFLQTISALSSNGAKPAAPQTSNGAVNSTTTSPNEQTVIVPTSPRVNEQGQVVNVISDATAAQYGVKPGVVNVGDTLSTTTTKSSSETAPMTVSAETATAYSNYAADAVKESILQANRTAQSQAEGSGGNSDSTASAGQKVAGKATAKSWLMAIAEALGGALGQKAQQMLNSTNEIANLTKAGEDLSAKFIASKDDKAAQEAVQTQQADNAHKFTLETSRLQGASQEFQMLQNAMSNTIKTLGESLGQLARKG